MKTTAKALLFGLVLLFASPHASALTYVDLFPQSQLPQGIERTADGQLHPQRGYDWVDPDDPDDLRVYLTSCIYVTFDAQGRPLPPGVTFSPDRRGYVPMAGFVWVTSAPGDYRVMPAPRPVVAQPVRVEAAQPADFVGRFAVTDPARPFASYHGDAEFLANGQGRLREFINGRAPRPSHPETMDGQGYTPAQWSFNPQTQQFLFDQTLGGRLDRVGRFAGTISGHTDDFTLDGTWSNGTRGQLRFQRVR